MDFKEMKEDYKIYSLGYLNTDINNKFALISLIDYLVMRLKEKKPDVTYYQVIYKIAGASYPEDFIKALAIVCEDFAYGCKEFPTFGIAPKEVPKKIKEMLDTYIPF